MQEVQFDLFELDDATDDLRPKNWIMAKGDSLRNEVEKLIILLENKGWTKTQLVKYIMNKLKATIVTAERQVL